MLMPPPMSRNSRSRPSSLRTRSNISTRTSVTLPNTVGSLPPEPVWACRPFGEKPSLRASAKAWTISSLGIPNLAPLVPVTTFWECPAPTSGFTLNAIG